jgi:hypothetical protein
VDVTCLGRKAERQHLALRRWAARTGRYYDYDATPPRDVASFAEHREALANHLVHSAAWVTNSARFDDPVRTGGVDEVGLRFFEALAGGCLLLGQLPMRSTVFQDYFADLPGLIVMPADASGVPGDLDRILDDDQCLLEARVAHRRRALLAGDTAHTLVAMLSDVGHPVPQELAARVRTLAEEARALVA